MENLVLYPSVASQWQALINEAQLARACQLNEELESYLVFLLMRYSTTPTIFSTALADEFFASTHLLGQLKADKLRDLGDKSLLFAGLFPGLAVRRHVSKRYFIDMGQSAYGILSEMHSISLSETYAALSEEFVLLTEILDSTRHLSPSKMEAQILQFMENSNSIKKQ